VVPQEAFLFTGTIRDNIAYGRPDASDAAVEAAARAVGAHAFVAHLPQGYLTPVSERGRSLSAGQRQLIALARAELVDPAILLLDEATSNLDLATEAAVQQAMGIVATGRTTILVATGCPRPRPPTASWSSTRAASPPSAPTTSSWPPATTTPSCGGPSPSTPPPDAPRPATAQGQGFVHESFMPRAGSSRFVYGAVLIVR
jgi:hypothetical protein